MGSNPVTNQFRGSQIHEPTPDSSYHVRRREDMRTRIKQYGFYPNVTEPIEPTQCSKCHKELIYGNGDWIRINGVPICGACLNARN